ncbi:uncharacterized protein N7500_003579 [Penicillium coprophilum]|uniref:uncharacterized protein n=1 Tax=Penicillium coprophilum TaxID=36646 RepID=UPI0023888D8A|nr:uncharacterized protein N7500_003579 [Penicillium coprophilum]KAJ5170796.1 hypothetical protein N7500_003579 [Penicillium coprophilum]
MEFEYHPELLDHICVKVPLTTVNHEARSVAIKWALEQGIEVRFHEGRQCSIFLRPFDPVRDVMWFNRDVLEDFAEECSGMHPLADLRQKLFVPIKMDRFAVSEHVC